MSEPVTRPPRAARCAPNDLSADHLVELATALATAAGPASAIGVRRTRHGAFDLLTHPLDVDGEGWHPADLLIGYHAPASWAAFGITATAVAHTLTPEAVASTPASPSDTAPRRHLAHLVARTGASCTVLGGALTSDDETTPTPAIAEPVVLTATAAVPGLTADACRRVLGLPTAALHVTPTEWVTTCWLDRIFARVIDRAPAEPPLSWPQLVAWHPCAPMLPGDARPEEVGELVTERLGDDWEAVHRAASGPEPARTPGGAAAAEVCRPEHAAWLDAPSFGRYLLAALPAQEVLSDLLDGLLGAACRAELRRACGHP